MRAWVAPRYGPPDILRLVDLADPIPGPGEILVSSTVKDLVAGSGLRFEDRGERQLKGVLEAWRVFSLAA